MILRRRYQSLQNNVIRYTGTSKVTPSVTTGFGANYLDNLSTWNSNTGEGIIVFDGNINNIPSNAFKGRYELTSITYLPSTIKKISSGAFRMDGYTSNATHIKLNEGIELIGNRAFLSNRGLIEMHIPDTVEKIEAYTFNTCVNMCEITFGRNLNCFIDSTGNESNNATGTLGLCYDLNKVNWNAVHCQDFVRASQSPFTSDSMFDDETAINPIETVVFGKYVEHIPAYLFWKAQSLTGCVEIPASCKSIGDRCFQACDKIRTVICRATTPPIITPGPTSEFQASDGKNVVFRRYVNYKWELLPLSDIYVPANSLQAYKNDANWSMYSDLMRPILEYKEIDLGLRTSDGKKILFADRNVGATSATSGGEFFAWGDFDGHSADFNNGTITDGKSFDVYTYTYSDSGYNNMTKYNSTDLLTTLEKCDDAALAHMGNGWRMPASDELGLLLDTNNFDMEILDMNGNVVTNPLRNDSRSGIRFVSKIAGFEGKSIFFPATGVGVGTNISDVNKTVSIWTSSLASAVNKGRFLYFYITGNDNISINMSTSNRYYGRQIRGVKIV